MTRKEATRAGNALLKRMKGKGWKLRVWENLGWHYAVYSAGLSVSPCSCRDGRHFGCLLSSDGTTGTGSGLWTDHYTSADPNKTVRHVLKRARAVVEGLSAIVGRSEAVLAGKGGK